MFLLTCVIGGQNFAFDLSYIERCILAVEITPVPNSSPFVKGAINLHGDIVPVIDMRKLLGIEPKELDLKDQFILANAKNQKLALWVDGVNLVKSYSKKINETDSNEKNQYVFQEEEQITQYLDLEKLLPTEILKK